MHLAGRQIPDLPPGWVKALQAVCGLVGLIILGYHGVEGDHVGLDRADVTGSVLTLGAAGSYFLRMLKG